VVESSFVPILISLIQKDDFVRWKVVHILSHIARVAKTSSKYLLQDCDIVRVFSSSLSFFKAYDPLLRDVYRYMGPYDFFL